MPEYQLEIRQHETYPRCRVSRGFVQALIEDRDIRTNGCPGLFVYTALCSCACPRKSYLRIEDVRYMVQPGEQICSTQELMIALRMRSQRQMLDALWAMQNRGMIQYTLLARGNAVKFKILDWPLCNLILDEKCLNRHSGGFFYLPAPIVGDLIGSVQCSEMDILLDLLLSAVHRDGRVKGSYSGPVVYLRNETASAVITYDELAERWGLPNATVCRTLRKFEELGYISVHGSPAHPNKLIYLAERLGTVFQASDTLLDKDELPMVMCVEFPMERNDLPGVGDVMAEKVLRILRLQGINCPKCSQCTYKLSPITQRPEKQAGSAYSVGFRMDILCGWNNPLYSFDLLLYPGDDEKR